MPLTTERLVFQLFADFSILFILSKHDDLVKFLEKTLSKVPTISAIDICLLDLSKFNPNQFASKFLGNISSSKTTFDYEDFRLISARASPDIKFYPVKTAFLFFGFIAIKVSNRIKFDQFESVISHASIVIASILENKYHKQVLNQQNQILQQHKKELESIVEKRTKSLVKSHKKIQQTLSKTIQALSTTVELRDPYTAGHQYRVAKLSEKIAQKFNFTPKKRQLIYLGALIHDIGKIQVPQEILSFPGELTPLQREFVQVHPKAGGAIIKSIGFDHIVTDIVIHHHERLDGSGYPHGLSANDIPLTTRIVAVADVFEAMTSHRPYRPEKTIQETLEELESNAGLLYDAKVVEYCIQIMIKERFKLPPFGKFFNKHRSRPEHE